MKMFSDADWVKAISSDDFSSWRGGKENSTS